MLICASKTRCLLALAVCALMTHSVAGRIIHVDDDAPASGDGSTWENAYPCLQSALEAAESGDEIRVGQGIYRPDRRVEFGRGGVNRVMVASGDREATFQLINGVAIRGGYAGLGAPDPNAREIELYETVLSGDLAGDDADVENPEELLDEPTRSENSYHVLTAYETDAATLEGFTVTAGNADGNDPNNRGGGLYNDSGSPTIIDCTFTMNTANYGGAIYSIYGNLTLSACTFSINCGASRGGGIYNGGNSSNIAMLTNCSFDNNYSAGTGGGMLNGGSYPVLADCTFNANTAEGPGGGMYNTSAHPSLTNCTFTGNSSERAYGGGMFSSSSDLTLTNCTFSSNSAERGGGGAFIIAARAELSECTFAGNSARRSNGGGIQLRCAVSSTLTRCRVIGNSAGRGGGGIYLFGGGSSTFTRCRISGNSTAYVGGGISNDGARMTVSNSIISGNSAVVGGGISNTSAIELTNCTLTGNSALSAGGAIYTPNGFAEITNCILWDDLPNEIDGSASVYRSTVQGGSGRTGEDPQFVEPGRRPLEYYYSRPNITDNFWIEGDYHLWPWSPCIDAGYYDDNANPEEEADFEGNPRLQGGGIDIGAYEGYGNSFGISDEDDEVSVPEGGTGDLWVWLMNDPCGTVEATLTFISGDSDITIVSPTAVVFDSNNYYEPQMITFAAAEDSDFWPDEAEFLLTAPGVRPATIWADVRDNEDLPDVMPNILYVDKNATGANDGTNWANAFTELTPAIDATWYLYTLGNLEEIRVARGTYTPAPPNGDRRASFDLPPLTSIFGGYAGATAPDPNERDVQQYTTTLSGDLNGNDSGPVDPFEPTRSDNSYHVVYAEALHSYYEDVVLDGFTITGGNANGPGYYYGEGGAISGLRQDGIVSNCTFIDNCALANGGAVQIRGYSGRGPTLTNCTFENNYAAQHGGAICTLAVGRDISARIQYCTFTGNRSQRGGAISNTAQDATCAPEFTGCTFTANQADMGGAAYNRSVLSACLPVFVDCTFSQNQARSGGGMYNYAYPGTCNPFLSRCTFNQNLADEGGGIYNYRCDSTLDECSFSNNSYDGIRSRDGTVYVSGNLWLASNDWEVVGSAGIRGDGTIRLQPDVTLHFGGAGVTCNISGPGVIEVPLDDELTIEGNSVVDLGEEANPSVKGEIRCDGLLRLTDSAQIVNAQINVSRASFEGDIGIYNSVITAEAGAPYGQFFVEDTASIIGNDIHADGDRFMDLDPAAFDGLIANNRIFVTITEGVGNSRGGLLELRGTPDLAGSGTPDPNNPFLCQVADVPEFDLTTWTLEELRLIDGAKVNLTNRFDFQEPYDEGGQDEVLYVRNLYLGAGSVLNTSFNNIYYQNLYADPCSLAENVPLLGFSLNNIAFDDEIDFITRVTHNNFESDVNPSYDMIHIERVENLEPDPNGMMRMCNFLDEDPCSPTSGQLFNARAKGLFARANEELILVTFEYLFETADPNVELVIYLTDVPELMAHDDPNRPDHYVEVARIASPPSSRPGSLGSARFGVFYAYAERGELDFLRGTRLEFELIGPAGSSILINNWDPQVHCNPLYCGDITGDWGATQLDYLTVLAHIGRRSELPHDGGASLVCMDVGFGSDGYVDALDAEAWDWRLSLPDPHFCDLPLIPTTDTKSAAGPLKTATAMLSELAEIYPSEGLLISGKRTIDKLEDDHYILDSEGQYISSVTPTVTRANGKLIKDAAGGLYQINLSVGLLRLSDGVAIVPPANTFISFNDPRYDSAAEVRIGLGNRDGEWSGCPIFDAAFDADGEHVYVAPVVVVPNGEEPYHAAARLRLLSSGEPPYEVVQIYDDPPPPGDNQYLDNLREIEIDDAGNLYVTNTDSLNESDTLWVYDSQSGQVKQRLCLGREGADIYVPAPTALHVSSRGSLYMASAVQQSDGDSASVHVLSAGSLAFVREIIVNNMGHVTSIAEDASTGTIWVAGFTMSDIPEYIDPLGEPFYKPYIAKIPLGSTGPIEAEPLSDPILHPDNDLALPLSIISIAVGGFDCSTANINGVGPVDFFDFVRFAAHWLETACGTCDGADLTGEGNVNPKDLQLLSQCWLHIDP